MFFLALATLPACGRAACAATQEPDRPVPSGEPRATLVVKVDLPRAANCEERFDLALYQDRGIDLVTWEPLSSCQGRKASIRYLSKRIDRARVLDAVKKLSLSAEVVDG